MTAFNIDKFRWDGMYLVYEGEYEGAKTYGEVTNGKCHPSRVDMLKEAFIARFKYGSKPWKKWAKFLVKNFTIEEYLALSEETSPLKAVESKGWFHPNSVIRRAMKEGGYPMTKAGFDQMISAEIK